MANSAVSYEYLIAQKGAANGLATLDSNSTIPETQLPPSAVSPFKGSYATVTDLQAAYPTAGLADYAFVTGAGFYYWSPSMSTPEWMLQDISSADYDNLTDAQKQEVPYIIVS